MDNGGIPPKYKKSNVRINDLVSRMESASGTLRGLGNRIAVKNAPTELEIRLLAVAALDAAEAVEELYASIIAANHGKRPRFRMANGKVIPLPLTTREHLALIAHDVSPDDQTLDN